MPYVTLIFIIQMIAVDSMTMVDVGLEKIQLVTDIFVFSLQR